MLLFLYEYSWTDADKALSTIPTDSHGGKVGVRMLGKVMKIDNAEKVARIYDSLVRHHCVPSVHHCKAGIRLNYFESLER
jgi:hypothetical protein